MPQSRLNRVTDTEIADPRWLDLYRVGAIACIALPVLIVLAIIAYFIWPYTPGRASIGDIFALLQGNRVAGLISLDLSVPLMLPIIVLQMLAMYAALKQTNDSYALIALVLGLMGIVLWLSARPLAEMAYLSDRYAAATSEAARSQYLAAGEALNALFNGTAWLLSQLLIGICYTICSLLMLRSRAFSRATAYVGIVLAVSGFGIYLPGIGTILALVGTLGGAAWYVLMARDFLRLGWRQSEPTRALPA